MASIKLNEDNPDIDERVEIPDLQEPSEQVFSSSNDIHLLLKL